jgi:hypothetical protein
MYKNVARMDASEQELEKQIDSSGMVMLFNGYVGYKSCYLFPKSSYTGRSMHLYM